MEDPEYKGMKPHMAVFWNPAHTSGVGTGLAEDEKSGTSSAGPSVPLVPGAPSPDIASLSIDQAPPARKIRKVKRPLQGDKDPAS